MRHQGLPGHERLALVTRMKGRQMAAARAAHEVGGKPRRQVIIFDADDTLWYTAPSYTQVLDECQALVAQAGLSGEEWRKRHVQLDVSLTATMHLSRRQFPLAARTAAVQLMEEAGFAVDPALADRVEALARSVFSKPLPLLPGVEAALTRLRRQGHHLVLLTKGDYGVQAPRIVDSGLALHFAELRIVKEKSPELFSRIAQKAGVAPADCWSVGNSLPSDINPALACGMRAVWIDADVWAYERRETVPRSGALIRANRITELPILLGAQMVAARRPAHGRELSL